MVKRVDWLTKAETACRRGSPHAALENTLYMALQGYISKMLIQSFATKFSCGDVLGGVSSQGRMGCVTQCCTKRWQNPSDGAERRTCACSNELATTAAAPAKYDTDNSEFNLPIENGASPFFATNRSACRIKRRAASHGETAYSIGGLNWLPISVVNMKNEQEQCH